MAWDALAQTKWSDKHLEQLRDAHVFKMGTNQDYEGEVRYAAALKIFMAARPQTAAYTRDSTTITYTRLTPSEQFLVIDNRQYWQFKVDKLEKSLSSTGGSRMFEEQIQGGAWELADDVDDFIRDGMSSATPSANTLTARTLGLGLNANTYDMLVDMSVVLDQNNVPRNMRHAFIPPNVHGLLKKDERFVSFNTAEAVSNIRGKAVGMVESLEIHVSNNIALSGSTYTVQAAWEKAFTYAEQLSHIEHFDKLEGSFDEAVRSELVFGGKAVQPQGLVKCAIQVAV